MESKDRIRAKDCIHLANDIIIDRNLLIPRLTSLKEVNYSFFLMVIDDIFELDCPELLSIEPKNSSQEAKLMTRLLSFISNDLFAIPLDHIKAEDIVDRNVNSVHDLLEIISTFIKYVPKKFDKEEDFAVDSKFTAKSVQTALSSDDSSIEKFSIALSPSSDLQSKTSSSSSSSSSASELIPIKPMDFSVDFTESEGQSRDRRSQESKGIQTDSAVEVRPQTEVLPNMASLKDVTIDEYKRLKYENFAAVLGNRLHETLKLKEMADNLEFRVKKYYGDVTAKTPQRTRSTSRTTSARKPSPKNKKTPQNAKKINKKMSQNKSPKSYSLDELLRTFPEIPRNTIKSLKEEESRQKKVFENLNKEISVNQMKVKSKLKDAIERQEKKSNIIGTEVKQMQTLMAMKGSKAAKMSETAAKRDSRIERARIHKMIDKFQNELNSKYKRLESIEERIVVKEFEKRQKQQKDCINDFRDRIRERHSKEMERQKRIIDSIDTLYQHKYEMLTENIDEEEKRLKEEIASQTRYLRSIKREIDHNLASDLDNKFKA